MVRHFERVCAHITASPRSALTLLGLVLAWEVAVLFLKASQKLFWYDELVTLHISSLQPLSLLWRALQAGADGTPPGYYVFVQLARLFPVDPHVALRAPSVLGYILTLLGVYWFIRKTLPVSAGLVAVILITLSPFREFALEARPYSLLTGFLAVSAALWQRIGEKRFATPAFALFLALAVSCHHLAVIAIPCFCLAELTWTLASRRIRWGVWAAFLFTACPFLLSLPLLMQFREVFGKYFWSRPDWSTGPRDLPGLLGAQCQTELFRGVFLEYWGLLALYAGCFLRDRRTRPNWTSHRLKLFWSAAFCSILHCSSLLQCC